MPTRQLELRQAVILAGGKGERLRPLTDSVPKPMALVNGKPFLDYLIYSLLNAGISRILLLLGYKAEVIQQRYGVGRRGQIDIQYSCGGIEDQTGKRLLNAYNLMDEHFLLLYADNYWPIELDEMLTLYTKKNAGALTTVFSNSCGSGEYGRENNIEVGEDSFIKNYDKKRSSGSLNGVDVGYFILAKSLIPKDIIGNVSFEQDLMPEFISRRKMVGYVTDEQYYYITDIESLKNFEAAVVKNGFLPLPEEFFIKG